MSITMLETSKLRIWSKIHRMYNLSEISDIASESVADILVGTKGGMI